MNNCDCAKSVARDECERPRTIEEYYIKEEVVQPSATTMQMGHVKAREVNIEQLDFGYSVRVGCQRFAIQDLDVLVTLLGSYMRDPEGFETMWREGNLVIGGGDKKYAWVKKNKK